MLQWLEKLIWGCASARPRAKPRHWRIREAGVCVLADNEYEAMQRAEAAFPDWRQRWGQISLTPLS